MTERTYFAATLTAVVASGCLLFAQQGPRPPTGPGPDQAVGQGQGRGAAGRGGRGPVAGGRSPDGFPQFIRPLASQDVLVRGKSLYEGDCAACHAADLRGVAGKGVNLLRSAVAMSDEHAERIGASLARHSPPRNFVQDDVVAISEYIHSVLATMGSQGSPPGRIPVGLQLNVLIGDPRAGKMYFDSHCASCHSATGDLQGIGAKYDDPRALQNAWVAGGGRSGGPFFGRGGGGGGPVTVTMPDGQKIEGRLVRQGDFLVVLTLADGTRRAIRIENGVKVDVSDPQAAHKKMVLELDDPQNKNMHDVTAYLATLK